MVAGIVGGPVTTVKFRLNDVTEMNYLSTDVDENGKPAPRGEIQFPVSLIASLKFLASSKFSPFNYFHSVNFLFQYCSFCLIQLSVFYLT